MIAERNRIIFSGIIYGKSVFTIEDEFDHSRVESHLRADGAIRGSFGVFRVSFAVDADEIEPRSYKPVRMAPKRVHNGTLLGMDTTGLVGDACVIVRFVPATAPLPFEVSRRGVESAPDDFAIRYDNGSAFCVHTGRLAGDANHLLDERAKIGRVRVGNEMHKMGLF